VRALLRFQAAALVREYARRAYVGYLAIAAVLVCLAATNSGPTSNACSGGAFAIVALLTPFGMTSTFLTLEAVRWVAPVRPGRVLLAHVLFWTVLFALPAAAIAVHHAGGAVEFAVLFGDQMLLVLATALAVPAVHRMFRDSRARDILAIPFAVAIWAFAAARSAYLAWDGEPGTAGGLLAALACVFAVPGTRAMLRAERLPAVSATTDPQEFAPVRRTARSPASTTTVGCGARMAWSMPVIAALVFLVPAERWWPFPAFALLIAAQSFLPLTLSSLRWLLPTPMARARIFRRGFLPFAVVAVALVAARVVIVELRPDRTVFFDSYVTADRIGSARRWRRDQLVLGQVLRQENTTWSGHGPPPVEVLGSGGRLSYAEPETAFMADRVREHLAWSYGLDVSSERIEASILRGWPAARTPDATDGMPWNQGAVFDAMERVRADLADDIVRADRRRNVLNASVLLLGCVALLRFGMTQHRRRWRATLVGTVIWCLAFLPQMAPESRAAAALESTIRFVELPFQRASDPVFALLLIPVAAMLFLGWTWCERAFSRLELTDLPPETNAWGFPKTGS
jgi:hypothetical protein